MLLMAMNWAACPLEAATAATPPSSAATRFSNTSLEYLPVPVSLDDLIVCLSDVLLLGFQCENKCSRMREDRIDPLRAKDHMCVREWNGSPLARPAQVSTYRTVVEDKGGTGIDGWRSRVGRRIDVLARVELQRLELGFPERRALVPWDAPWETGNALTCRSWTS